jgi:hypothetical protein
MIGRADIEESKSNVALNAWLPQASYPCGQVDQWLQRQCFGYILRCYYTPQYHLVCGLHTNVC